MVMKITMIVVVMDESNSNDICDDEKCLLHASVAADEHVSAVPVLPKIDFSEGIEGITACSALNKLVSMREFECARQPGMDMVQAMMRMMMVMDDDGDGHHHQGHPHRGYHHHNHHCNHHHWHHNWHRRY